MKRISVPIFGGTIEVFKDPIQAVTAYPEAELPNDCIGYTVSRVSDTGKIVIVVCVNNNINTITHEVVHVVHKIMEHNGIPINGENTEIQAYLAGWLVEEIMKDF